MARPGPGGLVGTKVVGGDHQLPQPVAVAVDRKPPGRGGGGFARLAHVQEDLGQELARLGRHQAVTLARPEHPLGRSFLGQQVAPVERDRLSQGLDGVVAAPGVPGGASRLKLAAS